MSAGADATFAAYLRGTISAPVTLMRLLLPGTSAEATLAAIRLRSAAAAEPATKGRLMALLDLAHRQQPRLSILESVARAGAVHGSPAGEHADLEQAIAGSRAMFDRLVAISPEASVAAYSLGDPALLHAATQELVDWLNGNALLEGRPAILDLGCGIGRLAAALAPYATEVLGIDSSPGMITEARARCAGAAGLRFAITSGRDLAGIVDGSFGLVLAVDVFPYLMQAGAALAARHVAEAARVLRPGGSLVVLNFSYRGNALDRRDAARMAASTGFELVRDGARDMALWDGAAYWFRRPA